LPIPDLIAFKIGLNNSVDGETVGFVGFKSSQYKKFEILKVVSSTEKLIALFKKHPREAVRCYSFWALTERKETINFIELLKIGLTDDRIVHVQHGDIGINMTVADFLILQAHGVINKNDSLMLDSLILFSDKNLSSKHYLLMKIKPKKNYYKRISSLALNQKNITAIIALAKFQKIHDIDLIFNQLKDTLIDPYYSLLAIKYMPNDTFANLLIQIQQKDLLSKERYSNVSITDLYKALVRIENIQIKNGLESFVEQAKEIQENKFLPDSIKYKNKNKYKFGNLIQAVSSYNHVRDSIENIENKTGDHLRHLRLALFDFPKSKYQYLAEKMNYDSLTLESIKCELSYTNDRE